MKLGSRIQTRKFAGELGKNPRKGSLNLLALLIGHNYSTKEIVGGVSFGFIYIGK